MPKNLQMNVLIFHHGHLANHWNDLLNRRMIDFHQGENVLNLGNGNDLLLALPHLHQERIMKGDESDKREDDLRHHLIHLPLLIHPMNHKEKGNTNQKGPKDDA